MDQKWKKKIPNHFSKVSNNCNFVPEISIFDPKLSLQIFGKNWRFSDQSWHSLQNLNFWTKTGGLEQCETLKRSVLVWFPLLNHTEADSGTIDQYPEWLLHTLWQHVSRSCNPDFSPQWISQQSWDWYPVRTQCTLS